MLRERRRDYAEGANKGDITAPESVNALSIVTYRSQAIRVPREFLDDGCLTPTKRSKAVPSYAFFVTEKEQADYIVSAVKKAHAKGIPYDEIAILQNPSPQTV